MAKKHECAEEQGCACGQNGCEKRKPRLPRTLASPSSMSRHRVLLIPLDHLGSIPQCAGNPVAIGGSVPAHQEVPRDGRFVDVGLPICGRKFPRWTFTLQSPGGNLIP